jgi:AcrR family transcriptional regulator
MANPRPDESPSATTPPADQVSADAPKPRWKPGEVTHQVIDAARAEDRVKHHRVEAPADAEPEATDEPEPEAAKRGRGRPRTRSVDEERAMILAAARSSFGELGFTGASIDDIAKRAGIQRRSVYRQFADKEELFQVAMASAIDHVLGQLSKAFARNETLDPEEALFRNYRRALEMVATDPSWSLVFLSSMSSTSELSTAAVVEGRRRLEAGIAASLRYRWELLGIEHPERAEPLATMMVGLVMTMGTRMSLEPDLAIDDIARLLTSFTIGGVIWIEAGH